MSRCCLILLIVMGAPCAAVAQDALTVLPESINGVPPSGMVRHYLLEHVQVAHARWQDDYEQIKTAEDIQAYQTRLRERFVQEIGGFPKRTPLNPQTTGTLEREGYRVEKVLFESQPGLYVTAAFFLPAWDGFKPPHPGVLVPCGHAENAKAHKEYQSVGALLALNGMAALVFDPVEQGERMQLLRRSGRHIMWGTEAHTMLGVGSILLGRNTAYFEIWDGMRGIDYLQSRPEVDPDRIGCTGNSGGGTQTAYLMALDDRIKAAAPSCFLNRAGRQLETATGDAEQNIFGQLAWGMDHADYLMMRAPIPILICAATDDFFDIRATWETFRYAKRRYTLMGYPERVSLLENDNKHNYDRTQREGVVRWMARWLMNRDEVITEPHLDLFTDEELRCTPRGQVMLLEGARSTYHLNADYENELAATRKATWSTKDPHSLLEEVRKRAGIRPLDALPEPQIEEVGTLGRQDYRIVKRIIKPKPGIFLPALLFQRKTGNGKQVILYVCENGMQQAAGPGAALERFVQDGATVLAVDLRGTGETQQTKQGKFGKGIGSDWEDFFAAYLLGKSYVGMRAEDLLVCARYAARSGGTLHLVAEGNVGVPALHAAALEPQLFARVTLIRTLASWSNVVRTWPTRNQLINTVHGALTHYDLPDLAASLGGRLTIDSPGTARGADRLASAVRVTACRQVPRTRLAPFQEREFAIAKGVHYGNKQLSESLTSARAAGTQYLRVSPTATP